MLLNREPIYGDCQARRVCHGSIATTGEPWSSFSSSRVGTPTARLAADLEIRSAAAGIVWGVLPPDGEVRWTSCQGLAATFSPRSALKSMDVADVDTFRVLVWSGCVSRSCYVVETELRTDASDVLEQTDPRSKEFGINAAKGDHFAWTDAVGSFHQPWPEVRLNPTRPMCLAEAAKRSSTP